MSRLFDAYIAVDWNSANERSPARPARDAVWAAEKLAPGGEEGGADEAYFRTRAECRRRLRGRLLRHASRGLRVLVGCDFAYGYPAGFARALDPSDENSPWRSVWREISHRIVDREDNTNNRFEAAADLNGRCGGGPGPLWGCPPSRRRPTLRSTSPGFPYPLNDGLLLQRLRLTDGAQRGVQEVWKLFGAGAVGGQALVGIPMVRGLREDPRFAPFSKVWPFETGFTTRPVPEGGPFVLHAEIFPGNAPDPLESGWIRDRAQVRAVVEWLCREDEAGTLGGLFAAPEGLGEQEIERCVTEEGWILGASRGVA